MKLFDLEQEINNFKRIVHPLFHSGAYIIKSPLEHHALILCDFRSMELRPFTFTVEQLFSDDWYVMD